MWGISGVWSSAFWIRKWLSQNCFVWSMSSVIVSLFLPTVAYRDLFNPDFIFPGQKIEYWKVFSIINTLFHLSWPEFLLSSHPPNPGFPQKKPIPGVIGPLVGIGSPYHHLLLSLVLRFPIEFQLTEIFMVANQFQILRSLFDWILQNINLRTWPWGNELRNPSFKLFTFLLRFWKRKDLTLKLGRAFLTLKIRIEWFDSWTISWPGWSLSTWSSISASHPYTKIWSLKCQVSRLFRVSATYVTRSLTQVRPRWVMVRVWSLFYLLESHLTIIFLFLFKRSLM